METVKNTVRLALAAGLAGLLMACENATLSTASSTERLSVLQDTYAAETKSDGTRDALLVARLTDKLQGDPATSEREIYISVSQGRARLSGFVDSAAAKLRAGALAAETAKAAANVALLLNLVLLVAVLSLFQATLTLPGIAGVLLTLGMAVDANVLINERIREEIRNGNTPQASIHAGYEKAFATIADANITTLIAAVMLFNFGTGPIKGFAITLSIGILTTMFTAVMGARAVTNLAFGGRKLEKVPV